MKYDKMKKDKVKNDLEKMPTAMTIKVQTAFTSSCHYIPFTFKGSCKYNNMNVILQIDRVKDYECKGVTNKERESQVVQF